MKSKKITSICLSAVMAGALLAGCGSSSAASSAGSSADSSASSASSSVTAASASGTATSSKYTIGICQLVQHPALDAATKGFEDELKSELGEDNVTFDEQNAAGDAATATQICTNLVSENVDLILANATAALQSAAAATSTIPILGTSITDYGVALDISDFSGTVGGNISGTSRSSSA
jgi:putative ABC transport system substrate-binding protein